MPTRKYTRKIKQLDEDGIKSISILEPRTVAPTADTVDLRKLIDRAVSESDWLHIIGKAKLDALEGDKPAREFLFKYRFGFPAPMAQANDVSAGKILLIEVNKTGDDETPIEIIENQPTVSITNE